jgi:hypothetical protein
MGIYPEDEWSRLFQRVGKHLPDYTASYPKKECSTNFHWKKKLRSKGVG